MDSLKSNLPKKKASARNASGIADAGGNKKIIPIILKADVSGSLEAIEKEIKKITNENAEFKIIQKRSRAHFGIGHKRQSAEVKTSWSSGLM